MWGTNSIGSTRFFVPVRFWLLGIFLFPLLDFVPGTNETQPNMNPAMGLLTSRMNTRPRQGT